MLKKNCLVCDKEFIKRKSGVNKFCSRKCFIIFQDKREIKNCQQCSKKGKWKRRFCSLQCYYVWKKGKPNNSSTKFKKGDLNGLKRLETWKNNGGIVWNKGIERDDISGNKHWNWQGGKTILKEKIRQSLKYKQWRKDVFIRDKYTCINCGARTIKGNKVYLQSHHLKPFYKIINDNKIKNIDDAKKCKELWDINNGETLCIPCHKQTDSYKVNQYNKNY